MTEREEQLLVASIMSGNADPCVPESIRQEIISIATIHDLLRTLTGKITRPKEPPQSFDDLRTLRRNLELQLLFILAPPKGDC